jgi:hypothetical protein
MSELMLHRPGSRRVTLDQLREIPPPESMGARHLPVPHAVLVESLIKGIEDKGASVSKMDLGIAAKGANLFGTMDILWDTLTGTDVPAMGRERDIGTTLGFRSSTRQKTAFKAVAGARTFVCDNMVLSGEEFVLSRKHTLYMNLPQVISTGINKFIAQAEVLKSDIDRLRDVAITENQAKEQIFDLFNEGTMPLHLFDDVARFYLRPQEAHTDCHPRTLWGLANACTRAIKILKPATHFNCATNIGRHFKLAS